MNKNYKYTVLKMSVDHKFKNYIFVTQKKHLSNTLFVLCFCEAR